MPPAPPKEQPGTAVQCTGAARLRAERAVAIGVVLAAIAAVGLFVLAARAYPGGTHFNRLTVGHDFWRNTLCDTARSTALCGAQNERGAMLARAAMTIMALGIGGLFWLLAERLPSNARLSAWVRALGLLAVPGAIAVVLLPTDRFGEIHGVAIVVAGVPGLTAGLLAMVGLLRQRTRAPIVIAIGTLALVVAATDFTLYVHELLSGGRAQVAVAVLERIATLLVLTWMLSVALTTLFDSRSPALDDPRRAAHAR